MKILLVTEKYNPNENQRDGGARLVNTLKSAFYKNLTIMQFDNDSNNSNDVIYHEYPIKTGNRFNDRIANANFIIEKVKSIEKDFTHIIFIHISMQFGLAYTSLSDQIEIWTFPMFLTPSYLAAGEIVPEEYTELEHLSLANSTNILTPSYFEKKQLIDVYSISSEQIHVIPRGVETEYFTFKQRSFTSTPKFCSIGSIKPQKNILGLVDFFAKVRTKYPKATLKIIGPIQDYEYYENVLIKIDILKLNKSIELVGYTEHSEISKLIDDAHIHISASLCETFGRVIFETLAAGIPNICKKTNNAATEFLKYVPYAKFIDEDNHALNAIDDILNNLSKFSLMSSEIGYLYDDKKLAKLLIAKISNKKIIAISDFDGTIFHKDDAQRTKIFVKAFQNFPLKVICTARPLNCIMEQLKIHNLQVDWIISYSGALVADGDGNIIWTVPIEKEDIVRLKSSIPQAKYIQVEDKILQVSIPFNFLSKLIGLRIENYQNIAFIANWKASKLHAICRLLEYLDWQGQVYTFGDSIYDEEFINYFDGTLITKFSPSNFQKKVIKNAEYIL